MMATVRRTARALCITVSVASGTVALLAGAGTFGLGTDVHVVAYVVCLVSSAPLLVPMLIVRRGKA